MKKVFIATFLVLIGLGVKEALASVETVIVPEPSALILLGSGLAGLFFFKKWFKK